MQTPDTSLLDLVGMNALKDRIDRLVPFRLIPDGYKDYGIRRVTNAEGPLGMMPLGTMGHEWPRFYGGPIEVYDPSGAFTMEEVAVMRQSLARMKDPVLPCPGKMSMPGPLRVMYGIGGTLLLDTDTVMSTAYKLPRAS